MQQGEPVVELSEVSLLLLLLLALDLMGPQHG